MSTSRDRFFATVRHERPDRPPMDLWARPEIIRALKQYLGTEDIETVLGVDFAEVGIADRFPEFERKTAPPRGGDWPGSAGRYIWHDERTYEDGWGIVQRVGQDGKLAQWIRGPLVEQDDLEAYTFPEAACLTEPAAIAGQVAALKAADRVVAGEVCMPFKRAWHLLGMENLLCDMIANREFVEALYDRIYAFETERAVRLARAGVDLVKVVGDIAMEDRLMFSPRLFRELDVPRLREMIRRTREVRPDVLCFYHSDGNLTAAIDDLIDVGFDIINPIQPECMDPYEIKRRWGDRITLWGTVSVRTTIPQGTPESIRAHVHERIRGCGQDGGFVLAPANVIMYDAPVENVIAFFQAGRDFKW
ncbi:MAG TPA: uroporphyrinogen decarboxylase family protein [Phycisphaerae bacterium]|nr:uroporphyrinogen decarboxylase family protein [Phycisphaerae bacterium]